MKFRCEREELLEALGLAQRAISSRPNLPILAGLRVQLIGNQLTITGSDLDLTITTVITVGGETDGVVVLPAKLINEIVRSFESGAVEISTGSEDGKVHIHSGRSNFDCNMSPADEYPNITDIDGEDVTLDASDLAEGLRQVVKAASNDDTRLILTGVMLTTEGTGLRMVSTDSYRLAVRDLPGTTVLPEGQSVIVPSRALNELARSLNGDEVVTLTLGERDATFQVGSLHLRTRLIEGEFPNYKGLIPDSQPNRLTVDRLALLDAVKRVRLMAREPNTPIRLTMAADSLELRATTPDVGEATEQLDANYAGEELEVAFNPEFLIDGLEVTSGDEITLETVDGLKPALLRPLGSTDFLYLLMPVRVT
ncbi:MAG: DNA polymerase III subunit beta [Actinomycetes bacterium]